MQTELSVGKKAAAGSQSDTEVGIVLLNEDAVTRGHISSHAVNRGYSQIPAITRFQMTSHTIASLLPGAVIQSYLFYK